MHLIKLIQYFPRPRIPDDRIEEVTAQQIQAAELSLPPGARIAITVGSRGIANLQRIVAATVASVKRLGGEPFIVPAMGSHGGATADGQRSVLAGYGITEAQVGAPVKSSMDVVELPQEGLENKVYMDQYAAEADGVILLNRVKLHTSFHAPIESGLLKMGVIGLGKHKGALELHSFGVRGLKELLIPTARQVLKHGKILLGVAIAENAYDETARIEAWRPADIEREERRMLEWGRANMPRLPLAQIDVLIIEEFGKHISGLGLDPNIIGRLKIRGQPEPEFPDITRVMLLDLSEHSHGNAIGMGLGDIITRRVFDKIDFRATYENVVTTTFLARGFMPLVADDARAGLDIALRCCGRVAPQDARIIRIHNTLRLDELWVSPRVLEELRGRPQIGVTAETRPVV